MTRLRLVHFPVPPLLVGRRDRLLRGAQELAGVAARTSVGFVPCVRSVCPPPFSGCSPRPRNAEARCGPSWSASSKRVPTKLLWVRVERTQRVAAGGCWPASRCASGRLASAAVGQGADSRIYGRWGSTASRSVSHPTRLETRTKKSNVWASLRGFCEPHEGAIKVKVPCRSLLGGSGRGCSGIPRLRAGAHHWPVLRPLRRSGGARAHALGPERW